jgi:5-methyltetrahydrofolate--homocysteine methyltransferase
MLDKIVSEKWLTAKGVCGFWPAARHGDDVVLHPDDDEQMVRLPFLRQQFAKSRGRANFCLADFIDPAGDWLGGFAVGIHGIEPHLARFQAAHDDYSDILLKALATALPKPLPSGCINTCAPRCGAMRRASN